MLFDLAAVISTSGALTGVADAFGVHEIAQQVYSNVVPADPNSGISHGSGDVLSPTLSPSMLSPLQLPAAVDPSLLPNLAVPGKQSVLPRLTGTALLDRLSSLPTTSVARFVEKNPAMVKKLMFSPPRATVVAGWWKDLSQKARTSLSHAAPELVGNLDGLPFAARDSANRAFLAQSISKVESSLASGVGRAVRVETLHHLDILTQISRALSTSGGRARQLLTFDPAGEGRAAVVVGDLATADYVSYLVPGMFFTVEGQMYDWTVIAEDLQQQQSTWLKMLSASEPTLVGKTAATVSWIGYETPGALDIASLDRAKSGANFLGHAVRGVQAARAGSQPYVSLLTHSYGSTAAMMELADGGMSIDALAVIGSPGSAAQSANALAVANHNVFVGEAAWDPIVNTAFYGSDPGSAAFGAKKMDVSGGIDAITHKPLAAAVGHLGYFDTGTEAMRNLALIGIDQGALVSDGTLADAARTSATRTIAQVR